MRAPLALVAVLVAMAVAGSASAELSTNQELRIWWHVCLTSDGSPRAPGPDPTAFDCGHYVGPKWNQGTIRKFEAVCLNALGGTSFSYSGGLFAEGVSCHRV